MAVLLGELADGFQLEPTGPRRIEVLLGELPMLDEIRPAPCCVRLHVRYGVACVGDFPEIVSRHQIHRFSPPVSDSSIQ